MKNEVARRTLNNLPGGYNLLVKSGGKAYPVAEIQVIGDCIFIKDRTDNDAEIERKRSEVARAAGKKAAEIERKQAEAAQAEKKAAD